MFLLMLYHVRPYDGFKERIKFRGTVVTVVSIHDSLWTESGDSMRKGQWKNLRLYIYIYIEVQNIGLA